MVEITKQHTDAAIDFLKKFYPAGPWHLSAKHGQGNLETRAFFPATEKECREFIERHNGQRNMYVAINEAINPMGGKAGIKDIKQMNWLHVDVDANAGEDVAEELDRIWLLLTDKRPKELPEPTLIIRSGGGCWALWRLDKPIMVNGSEAVAEDLKLYNLQITHYVGGDNCHNLDRIMRLPFTLNIPDEKKQKKGRTPTLSEVAIFNDNVYSIEQFKKAPEVQVGKTLGFQATPKTKAQISGNIERIQELDELKKYELPDRVLVIIQGGQKGAVEILGPKVDKDNSRSAWLFDALCEMARRKVPDDIMYALITDPSWGISESILDKENPHKHAVHNIERAKAFAIDPNLAKMNEDFAVIGSIGGKCRIIEEVKDYSMGRTRLIKQTREDFQNRFANQKIEVMGKDGPVYVPKGKWWFEHPERRQYDHIAFLPNQNPENVYNLWRGFAYEPRPGDCDLYLQHLREVVCSGNEEYYEYLIRWMARAVQDPGSAGQTAVVLRGDQGTGKGLTIKIFGSLFGRHFIQVSDSKHLTGNFNSHLRDAVVVFADEAFYAGDKKHESILKTLVTEPHIMIEGKGVDAEMATNCIHLMMASNSEWVVPAGKHERRYFVLDVKDTHRQDTTYFGAMMNQMERGGYNALLLYLQNLNLTGFRVEHVPKTSALNQQQDFTLTHEESWWFEKLSVGNIINGSPGWPNEVIKDELYDDWLSHCRKVNVYHRGTETAWNLFMKRMLDSPAKVQKIVEVKTYDLDNVVTYRNMRKYLWKIPSLENCRKIWEKLYGPRPWDDSEIEGDPELELEPSVKPSRKSVF